MKRNASLFILVLFVVFPLSCYAETTKASDSKRSSDKTMETSPSTITLGEEGVLSVRVKRLNNNPIIRPNMDERMGSNINGPSLIRVPDWVENPLGKYYLYFANHKGRYIRLAYADRLEGPC